MIDIASKMRDLVEQLRHDGFGGLKFPEVRASLAENWNENYAIVDAFYADDLCVGEYWDADRYECDLMGYVRSLFPDCVVRYRCQCQELEIYREAGGTP